MNVNKVWIYIGLLCVVVAGVWMTVPDEQAQQQMKEALERKKAAKQQKLQTPKNQAASAAQ